MIVLYVLFGILVLILLIGLTLPRVLKVEQSRFIPSNISNVFNKVNHLPSWKLWSVWDQMDPNMNSEYSDPDTGTGAVHNWKSNNKKVGNGSMKITNSVTDKEIDISLSFAKQGESKGNFTFTPENDGVNVTWAFEFDNKFNVVGRIFGVLMKKVLEQNFAQGLENLEVVSTNQNS